MAAIIPASIFPPNELSCLMSYMNKVEFICNSMGHQFWIGDVGNEPRFSVIQYIKNGLLALIVDHWRMKEELRNDYYMPPQDLSPNKPSPYLFDQRVIHYRMGMFSAFNYPVMIDDKMAFNPYILEQSDVVQMVADLEGDAMPKTATKENVADAFNLLHEQVVNLCKFLVDSKKLLERCMPPEKNAFKTKSNHLHAITIKQCQHYIGRVKEVFQYYTDFEEPEVTDVIATAPDEPDNTEEPDTKSTIVKTSDEAVIETKKLVRMQKVLPRLLTDFEIMEQLVDRLCVTPPPPEEEKEAENNKA